MANPSKLPATANRSGHLEIIGETAAKLLLFQHGWNPYSRFLDVDKVDLVLRRSRKAATDYREIQVKYRRLWAGEEQNVWSSKLFDATAWYTADKDEFAGHRPSFFIMFIFGYSDRRIEEDVLIFPSKELHALIQRAPLHKKNGDQRSLYLCKSRADSRWHLVLTRRKFSVIDAHTCEDLTKYRNNFSILD